MVKDTKKSDAKKEVKTEEKKHTVPPKVFEVCLIKGTHNPHWLYVKLPNGKRIIHKRCNGII
jgi:hypothetical protein